MLPNLKSVSIFLASPGDVPEEREAVRQVVAELDISLFESHMTIRVVGWDTHSLPQYGGDPQSLVNGQIADMTKFQLFVGVMRNRIGTATPRAISGTIEEFERAAESWKANGYPDIMLYFGPRDSGTPVPQAEDVSTFQKRAQGSGLVWSYLDVAEFKELFRKHLTLWLARKNWARSEPAPAAPAAAETDWLLLADHFYQCESVSDGGGANIVAVIVDPDSEGEAILKTHQGQNWGRAQTSYAHDNDGGMVQVDKAERVSKSGHVRWTVTLTIIQDRNSIHNEFTFNKVTPDQIAEVRARLLLLNERPRLGHDVEMMLNMGGVPARQVKANILPHLWVLYQDPRLFPKFARLWAVFYLKTSHTIEHVLELSIGEVHNGRVSIKFKGLRPKRYTDQAFSIEFSGECILDDCG